jgi:PAS domain S-box-containing protein
MNEAWSRNLYEALFEDAPFGYVVIDTEGGIAAANRKAARLLELSREELLQKNFLETAGSADRQRLETWCRKALTTGRLQSGELQIRCGSGDTVFAHLQCSARRIGDGDHVRLLVGMIDITDRKEAETQLAIERDNLTDILNAMEDGVYIVNDRHRIEYINPALQKEFGAINGRPCYEYFHNRQSACPWCKNEAVFSGRTVRWEWYSSKTGRTYDLVDTPLQNADGSILKLEIFRDITHRKQAESALQESEERFRVAFETSPNSVAIAEIDTGVIVSVNEGFTDFTEYPKEAVIGKSSVDIPIWANPGDRDRMVAELRRSGEINNLEAEFQTRSGQIKTGLISGRVIRLHDRPYLLSVTRDISEIKKTRKKLEASQRILQVVNRHSQMVPMLQAFIKEVQVISGCSAVGMRILNTRGSIPFAAFTGYSRDFLATENPLSIHSADTMCVRVVRQHTDTAQPGYTPKGAFFTNESSRFLECIPESERERTCRVCSDHGFESIALIPIRLADQILGLIHVADAREGMVPADLVEMLENEAMQVGATIQRLRAEEGLRRSNEQLERRVRERTAELAETNRLLTDQIAERKLAETAMRKSQKELRILSGRLLSAEEHERKRIAVELHDGIGQALSAIKFGMENVLHEPEQRVSTASLNTLKALIPLTRQTIEEVRRICKDLRPSILDDLGIMATIGWFCREFQSLYSAIHIERQLDVTEDEIPERLKTVIYRILQEALNNVAKHSTASRVHVQLKRSDSAIRLVVADNGSGFDLDRVLSLKSRERGIGLASMRERAELTGGDFQVVSTPHSGTQIRICWPATAGG